MDIHVTIKKNKSLEVVYVFKVRQLFSKHIDSRIVSSVGWRAVQIEKNVVCCVAMSLMRTLLRTMCELNQSLF